MPGTLDRRYCRERRTPFDEALLVKAAVDLSRSYEDEQAAAVDLSAACSSSMLRSSDVTETGPVSADSCSSHASHVASSETDVNHCQQERTPQESADIPAVGSVDMQGGDLLKSTSLSADDDDRKTKHSHGVVYRQRRSRSDEAKTERRRWKEFASENVGVGRRRCRSLERRQSSTNAKQQRCDALTSTGGRDRSSELGSGGTVRKSDSFDSGIDTKSESTSPRTAGTADDVVDSAVNSRPDVGSPPSSTFRDVTPEVLSLTAAEVEYDRKAATLVCRIDDDNELLRVLTSSESYRVPTCYMSGVFDSVVRPLSSSVSEADECTELSVSDDRSATTDELKVGTPLSALNAVIMYAWK